MVEESDSAPAEVECHSAGSVAGNQAAKSYSAVVVVAVDNQWIEAAGIRWAVAVESPSIAAGIDWAVAVEPDILSPVAVFHQQLESLYTAVAVLPAHNSAAEHHTAVADSERTVAGRMAMHPDER